MENPQEVSREEKIAALPKIPRDQLRYDKPAEFPGRRRPLCIGNNNTCEKLSTRVGGVQYCAKCLDDIVPKERTTRQSLVGQPDGAVVMHGGRRWSQKNGYVYKLCIGKNDTCPKRIENGDQCGACASGVEARRSKANYNAGDTEIFNGIRQRFNGTNWRRLCTGDGDKCEKLAQRGKLCSAHTLK